MQVMLRCALVLLASWFVAVEAGQFLDCNAVFGEDWCDAHDGGGGIAFGACPACGGDVDCDCGAAAYQYPQSQSTGTAGCTQACCARPSKGYQQWWVDIATEFSTATARLVANEAAKVALEALCATIPDQAMVIVRLR